MIVVVGGGGSGWDGMGVCGGGGLVHGQGGRKAKAAAPSKLDTL